jgi:subtilisin-like proprotein convertase family protein
LGSGLIALLLSRRKDLTWRDVQAILIKSAVVFNEKDSSWKVNGVNRKYSNKFGFGKGSAYRMIEVAKDWNLLGPHVVHMMRENNTHAVFKNEVQVSLNVSTNDIQGPFNLEHVTVILSVDHERRGDLEFDLVSPSNVVSNLAGKRMLDSHSGLFNWTFMTVVHWGEKPFGEWKLVIRNSRNDDAIGRLLYWRLVFWGETTVAHKATLVQGGYNDESMYLKAYWLTALQGSSAADRDKNSKDILGTIDPSNTNNTSTSKHKILDHDAWLNRFFYAFGILSIIMSILVISMLALFKLKEYGVINVYVPFYRDVRYVPMSS